MYRTRTWRAAHLLALPRAPAPVAHLMITRAQERVWVRWVRDLTPSVHTLPASTTSDHLPIISTSHSTPLPCNAPLQHIHPQAPALIHPPPAPSLPCIPWRASRRKRQSRQGGGPRQLLPCALAQQWWWQRGCWGAAAAAAAAAARLPRAARCCAS